MFVAGYGRRAKALGHGPTLDCPNCHNRVETVIVETSRRVSLMFVPVAKWDSEFWLACPICERAGRLDGRAHAQLILAESLSGGRSHQLLPTTFERLDQA